MTARPALEMRGIVKRFGPVTALDHAGLSVCAGEVHALLGENGAGKSTLMHVAYGMMRADAGDVRIGGLAVRLASPRDARALGVGLVHQHFTSIPSLTVAENVALAAGWAVRPAALHSRVERLVESLGLPLDPAAPVESLSVALRQRLEIVKALAGNARVLLLDEPTAVLAPREADELLHVIRAFAARGNAAVLITHKLSEALAVADRVTVLRRGRVIRTGDASDETPARLAAAMIGDATGPDVAAELAASPAVGVGAAPRPVAAAESVRSPVLVTNGLVVSREGGGPPVLTGVSLVVDAGEIVGIAGVEGNGQRELLRTIAGLRAPVAGQLAVTGHVSFIAEDRTTEGLIPDMSLTENVVLGTGDGAPWIRRGRIRWREARERTAALIQEFAILAAGPDAPASSLSGGNQQKLVIARALELVPRVLVAENPTRGLDLRAAAAVHRHVREAARRGMSVVFASSDLDEVLLLADRIVVAAGGALLAPPPAADRSAIGALMVRSER